MSIECRCLLVKENGEQVWSDKVLRLPPRAGDALHFKEGDAATYRIVEVIHTPYMMDEGGPDFALLLREIPGTRGKPFREILEDQAGRI